MKNITSLLSANAKNELVGMSTTELLAPAFINQSTLLTKRDKQKLNIIRESYQQYATDELKNKVTITSTIGAEQYLKKILINHEQEILLGVFLDTKNNILGVEKIFKGSLNSSVAHPRDIFREAILYNSARIIVAHNHPSGDPTPSQADLNFTKRMIECGDLMGIELLDHIIVGDDCLSLRDETTLF